jgi:ATP-binding cassette, subfamily C (CFTR/MRP), member 1
VGERERRKLAAIAVYGILQLVSFVLSHAEHVKSIRPSSIISLNILLTVLFDVVQCRTLWLLTESNALAILLGFNIAIKICIWYWKLPIRDAC